MDREIILIRHAKSSWEDPSLSDKSRPLNQRGKKDAPEMADYIHQMVPTVDIMVCSTAKRTRQTAEHFIEAWDLASEQLHFLDDLYHASVSTIEKIIRSMDEQINRLAVIGHNPGLTEAINRVPHVHLDNLPTCGVYRAAYEGPWGDFSFGTLAHLSIVYPKMLP